LRREYQKAEAWPGLFAKTAFSLITA